MLLGHAYQAKSTLAMCTVLFSFFFLVVGNTSCSSPLFILEGKHAPYPKNPRNFSEVEGPEFYILPFDNNFVACP